MDKNKTKNHRFLLLATAEKARIGISVNIDNVPPRRHQHLPESLENALFDVLREFGYDVHEIQFSRPKEGEPCRPLKKR